MPDILIPVADMAPDLGEISPPNNNMLIVENLVPTVAGYDKQLSLAPNSTKNPVVDFATTGPAWITGRVIDIYATKYYVYNDTDQYNNTVEIIFAATENKIYAYKSTGTVFVNVTPKSAAIGNPECWINKKPEEGGRGAFTRFGKYVVATNLLSKGVFIFDLESFITTGTNIFKRIEEEGAAGIVGGFGSWAICSYKTNIFLGNVNIDAPVPLDGMTGYQQELLWWSDDFSPVNWGSSDQTPSLAGTGYLRLIDNFGAITALAPTDQALYVFKDEAIYVVNGPPYTHELIVSGIGTRFPNTVFVVKDTVYFWSQQGPARIGPNGLEVMGDGKWSRMISGADVHVPTTYFYRYPRILTREESKATLNNIPCGAYDYETNNVMFAFPGRVRNMSTPANTESEGITEKKVVQRNDLASTVDPLMDTMCDTVITINTLTGASSISYPMSLEAAITDSVPNVFGFRGLVQRPKYNTVLSLFRNNNTYESATDYEQMQFGSMTTNVASIVTSPTNGLTRYIAQMASTVNNKIAIVTPWIKLSQDGTAKVISVQPVFLTPDGIHVYYTGLEGAFSIDGRVHRKSSAGAEKITVQKTGVRRDGTLLFPEDRFSKFKCFEIEIWRGYNTATPPVTPFNTVAGYVPHPGKLIGLQVEFAEQQKETG